MIKSLFGNKEPEKTTDDEEPKKNLFDRMRQAVSRTRETFSSQNRRPRRTDPDGG